MIDFLAIADQACPERWQIYQRLQTLGIECCCGGYHPLSVQVKGPNSVVQIWSVMQSFYSSPDRLKNWLEQCWALELGHGPLA
jgi:TfoX/Sxy family transcriptional regulator of competence genes